MSLCTERRIIPGVPASLQRVQVVGKFTKVMEAQEANDDRTLALIKANDPSVKGIAAGHAEHLRSLHRLFAELDKRCIRYDFVRIDQLSVQRISRKYDAAIGVGGDGTIIDVAKRSGGLPVLGVNSVPSSSHGHFCLANPDTFGTILDKIIADELKPLRIMRLRAYIDGKSIGQPALNEIFVENSSGSSTYILRIGDKEEVQMSDGVIFGSAAGSTAWMRWYDCQIMDIGERRIQYMVRGPNPDYGLKLVRGFIDRGQRIQLVSRMGDGYLAIDGRRNQHRILRGSTLEIRPARSDIRLYADPNCNAHYRQPERKASA
jgi:ATP-NAD kinase N-terminal domain